MINFPKSMVCRFIASFLAFILVQTAPGFKVYEALAQVQATAGTAGVTQPGVAPIRIGLNMPSANMTLPSAGLGLTPTLSAPSGLTPLPTPSVAVKNSVAVTNGVVPNVISAAVVPLSFRASVLPAASKADAPSAPALQTSGASAALVDTGAKLSEIAAAKSPAASGPSALIDTLSRLFDGESIKGTLSAPVLGDAPSSVPSALTPASPLSAAASGDVPSPTPNGDAPKAPGRARVTIGLALASAGAGAAWWTHVWAAATIGSLLAPWIGVPALALTISWIGLGSLAGFAAFSVETWKGFPSDLAKSATSAGGMTFRFWARFGLIFDSVLRGKTADMKAPTPANILKYPVIAWLFVLAGYVMAPAAFVLGAAYRLIGTPFLAAFRGAREVIVGFLPWMARVFRFLGRFLVRIFPFVGGLIAGALKTAFFGAAAGAAILAGPIGRDAFESDYKPATLPGWIGYRLTQLAALVAIIAVGAVGAVIGLISSPVHVVMGALELAFKWSNVNSGATVFTKNWMRSVENDGGFKALLERGFPLAKEDLSLSARLIRVLNGTGIALYTALVLPFLSLATLVRATSAARAGRIAEDKSSGSGSRDESGAEPAIPVREGFILPAIMGGLGFLAGAGAYGYLLLAPAGLLGWAAIVAAGVVGAAFGLALSQPQAWSGWLTGIRAESALGAKQSFDGWLDAGGRTAAALRGDAKPRENEPGLSLAIPGIVGAIFALASAVLGGVLGAVAKPAAAAWAGFMAVVTQFLPALKHFLNWALEVVKNVVPFVCGFVFGTIGGVFRSAWFVASNLFRPLGEVFGREDKMHGRPSEWQITAGVALGLTLLAPAAAIFAGGLALGAIVGIPVALTHGVALGVKWAGTGEKSEAYFRTWERRSLPNELKKAHAVVEPKLAGEGAELPIWRVYVRAASWALTSIPTALALVIAGGAAYVRSLSDAKLKDAKPEADKPEAPDAPVPTDKPEAAPAKPGIVWVSALLGAAGVGAGIIAAIAFGPAWLTGLAGWKLWLLAAAVYAGVPFAASGVGLALSQPALYTNLIGDVTNHAKAGFGRSLNYWAATGKPVGLTPVYGFIGGVLGLVWAVAGAGFGVLKAGSVAAYNGARQVIYEILPFLRTAWETAMKVARRVFPFAFGLIAGLLSGVLGSAAFGALLLGRPYFKHVLAEDFKHSGAVGFIGNILLKLVSLVLGVIFGVIGIAAGIIAALPYALTASIAFAFRFAEIGGPVQKYFDHWTYGALRAEMQRLNQLTDRFQFPEGEPALSDGWIRTANILPATIAAAFAGAIAGWVGYFRSLGVAYKSAKAGGPIPSPVIDQQTDRRWNDTWHASKKAASSFFAWGIAGAVIGLGIMIMTSWTPLGLAGWLLVGAAAGVGVLGALTLGGIIAAVALILWIDGQLR